MSDALWQAVADLKVSVREIQITVDAINGQLQQRVPPLEMAERQRQEKATADAREVELKELRDRIAELEKPPVVMVPLEEGA